MNMEDAAVSKLRKWWELGRAELKAWSDEDITAAMKYLMIEMPEACAELEKLELAGDDYRGSRAFGLQLGSLSFRHPDCTRSDIIQLSNKVRTVRRAQLGLK